MTAFDATPARTIRRQATPVRTHALHGVGRLAAHAVMSVACSLACTASLSAQTPPAAAPVKQNRLRYNPTQPTVFPGAKVPFPALDTFVRGEPVTAWEPGRTYAIEFFSTGCSHCEEAAPLVHALAEKYGPLGWSFIGVTHDSADEVRAWLESAQHQKLALPTIASDPDRSAEKALQEGSLQNLSPRLFVVRDGTVLWFGHPEIAEEPLAAIAAGTWNPAAEKPKFVLDAIVARARKQASARVTECDKTGDYTKALDLLDAIATAIPERASTFELQKFGLLVGAADKPVEGYELGKQLAIRYAKDMVVLRTLVRTTLSTPEVRVRDLDFAFAVARAADILSKGEDARANELLALAYFSRGDRDNAIKHQTKAIELQTNPKLRANYESQLAKYRRDEPKPVPYTPRKTANPAVDAAARSAG